MTKTITNLTYAFPNIAAILGWELSELFLPFVFLDEPGAKITKKITNYQHTGSFYMELQEEKWNEVLFQIKMSFTHDVSVISAKRSTFKTEEIQV